MKKADYIFSKDILKKNFPNALISDLINDTGHPTNLYNQLIADEIKRKVLSSSSTQ